MIETLALSLGLSDLSERERLRAVWVADAAPRSLSSRISHQQQDIDQESHMGAKVIDWIDWVGLGCIDDDHEDREEKEEEDRLACSTTQGHACAHTHWVLSAECGARAVCRYCDGLWAASHSCTFGCAAKACCNATTCECESCVCPCAASACSCATPHVSNLLNLNLHT